MAGQYRLNLSSFLIIVIIFTSLVCNSNAFLMSYRLGSLGETFTCWRSSIQRTTQDWYVTHNHGLIFCRGDNNDAAFHVQSTTDSTCLLFLNLNPSNDVLISFVAVAVAVATAKDKDIDANEIMPMVTIRDPLFWLKSMCRHHYTARWDGIDELDHCPNFLQKDLTTRVKYDGFTRTYPSLVGLYSKLFFFFF